MKLEYVGHLGGSIEVAAHGRFFVTDKDGLIEVPDDLGNSLLEQSSNWAKPSTPPPPLQEID